MSCASALVITAVKQVALSVHTTIAWLVQSSRFSLEHCGCKTKKALTLFFTFKNCTHGGACAKKPRHSLLIVQEIGARKSGLKSS